MNFFLTLFHDVFYQPIYNVLMVIYAGLHSFPLALVVMTLLFRVLLIPLYMKQLSSSKAMQEIGPEVQEIQRKYRQEPQVLQKELNALYKSHGVNPYMGCLPLVIQLPFIYGLYGAFNNVLNAKTSAAPLNPDLYPFVRALFGPNGIMTKPNLDFLWLNLAKPDPIYILPVLAGVGTFVQIRMSMARNRPKPKPGAPPDPNAASMQMMQYIMPAFTLFIALRFSAGIALYWTITTLFTIGQQYFVNGRSWGPLLKGIPFLDPAMRPALAVANGAALVNADSDRRGGYSRNRVAVEADPAPTSRAKSLPAGRAPKPTPESAAEVNAGTDDVAPSAPPPRPAVSKTVSRPLNKGNGVRLVSAGQNGNGAAPVVAPRTATRPNAARPAGTVSRPVVATAKPKTASAANGSRPVVKTTTRPRKGGK